MTPVDITPKTDGSEEDPTGAVEYVEEYVEYKDTRRLRTVLGVTLAILILLLAGLGYAVVTFSSPQGGGAAAVSTGEMQWVRSIYGWGPAVSQQMVAPTSVAISGDGTIWANSQNKYAVAYTPDGKFDRIMMSKQASATAAPGRSMGASSTPKPKPSGVATPLVQTVYSVGADSSNNLYIADNAAYNALKFTPEARLVKGWAVPGMNKLSANDTRVAILSMGSLGVFEQGSGAPVFALGSRGQGINQFDLPVGVFIDKQNFVYVADTQNRRVRKYSPAGKLLWDQGTPPDRKVSQTGHTVLPPGQIFDLPSGVTVDGNGRVVVVDAFMYQIIVLDGQTGKKIATYGDYGQLDGQFDTPSDIAYDASRDQFVVADTGNNRLQVIRLPGSGSTATQSLVRRLFDRPVWILCLPFILLALLALLLAALRRRNRDKPQDEPVDEPAAEPLDEYEPVDEYESVDE